jgi:hypothetical protein
MSPEFWKNDEGLDRREEEKKEIKGVRPVALRRQVTSRSILGFCSRVQKNRYTKD